jgi:gliding motility-associated-like protein
LRVLSLFALPVVTLDDNPELCIGSTRTLQAGSFTSYLWHDGSTDASYEVNGTGIYHVTVEDNNGCEGSDTVRITQILPLPARFLPGDTSICNYASLLLRPQGSYSEYLWNTNATGVSITVTQPGEYWLRVTDSHDCTGADTILVLPKECLVGLYAPNAFSPNNDGWNDTFRPIVGGIVESYELTIYNRYGQRIYSTKDLHRGWDGTIAGIRQDSNTFAWTCRYKLEGQPERMERGTVTLVR